MSQAAAIEPRVLPRSEHPISRKEIDPNALKVLYRLDRSGYKGYLVGGSVRDLMLGRQPKDFDVGTDARPNEMRRLFRNCRIIGRRFRLAHVFFKEGIIEVSTFRRTPDPEEQERDDGDLLVTRDNVYGTPQEDALRRDFTVNGLFYDISDFSVIDYVGGIEDLERRLIRTIGDPDLRFQEDPVRMLRACEYAGRLGFGMDGATQEAIERHRKELRKASPARLTEELVELVKCGRAAAAFQWMLELGLVDVLVPEVRAMAEAEARGLGEFTKVFTVIDRLRTEGGRQLSDTVLLAAILLPHVLLARYDVEASQQRHMTLPAVNRLVQEAVEPFFARFTLPKQRAHDVTQALQGFPRLAEPGVPRAERARLVRKGYFEDSLALLEILSEATGEGKEAVTEWRRIADRVGPGPARPAAPAARRGRRRRGRRRRSGRR